MTKRILSFFMLTAILFGVITWLGSSLTYNADGADRYGFPFTFFSKVNGYDMITKTSSTVTNFNFFALTGDIVLILFLSWLIITIYKRIFNRTVKN